MTKRISHKRIAEALRKTHGNFMLTAQILKCSRVAVWKRVKESKELQEIVEEEREGVVDIAESALQRAVLNGEAWAIQFTLRNLGRDRGYFEKAQHELTGKDNGPIQVRNISAKELLELANQLPLEQ